MGSFYVLSAVWAHKHMCRENRGHTYLGWITIDDAKVALSVWIRGTQSQRDSG